MIFASTYFVSIQVSSKSSYIFNGNELKLHERTKLHEGSTLHKSKKKLHIWKKELKDKLIKKKHWPRVKISESKNNQLMLL